MIKIESVDTILQDGASYNWPNHNCIQTAKRISQIGRPALANVWDTLLHQKNEGRLVVEYVRRFKTLANAYSHFLTKSGWHQAVGDPSSHRPGDVWLLSNVSLDTPLETEHEQIDPKRMAFMCFWSGRNWLIWTRDYGFQPIRTNLDAERVTFRVL